ncbi:hypothetical protein FRC07_010476 [Ceratobasidium sp. 392]|nr:hypothetical protein FRC07_010476 [Ceratobasidium sp. 392]
MDPATQPLSTETLTAHSGTWSPKSSVFSGYMPESPSLRMMSLYSPSSIRLPDGKITYSTDGRVLTGNIVGLVDRLLVGTESREMDEEFQDCFLAVSHQLVEANDLLLLLIERYEARVFEYASEWERVKLHENVMAVMAKWLETQELWPEDHPAAIARHLMGVEGNLFQKIPPAEYIAWIRPVTNQRPPNLLRFMENNTKISIWCLSVTLSVNWYDRKEKLRAEIIMIFTRIAEECLRIRSFSTAHAIMRGLSSDLLAKLGYAWKTVDKRTKKLLKHIKGVVFDVNVYMASLQGNPEIFGVPNLPLHIKELRQSHEKTNHCVVQDSEQLIDFQVFEKLWRSVKEITKYRPPQGLSSTDPAVSAYIGYIFSSPRFNDDEKVHRHLKAKSVALQEAGQRYNMTSSGLL